jgi:hypothetical protein
MHIKVSLLKLAKPENVIRLARAVGLTTEDKLLDQIIQEVYIRINYGY